MGLWFVVLNTKHVGKHKICPQVWTRAWRWQEACWHYRNRCRRFKVIVGPGVQTAKCVHKCVSMFSNVALLDTIPSWRWVYWILVINTEHVGNSEFVSTGVDTCVEVVVSVLALSQSVLTGKSILGPCRGDGEMCPQVCVGV